MSHSDIRLDVQGLRAVAVLGVIAFHYNSMLMPGGFGGVDVFFVISGFIISRVIINNSGDFSWIDFYWSRIKRIFPAYFVMLSVVTLFGSVLFLKNDFDLFIESLKASSDFSSNHYFSKTGNYFAPNATEWPLLHTWSLAIEMQFYMLLPIFLVFVPSRFLKTGLLLFIVLGFGFAFYQAKVLDASDGLYFSLFARIPEFLLGAYLAVSNIGKDFNRKVRVTIAWIGCLFVGLAFLENGKSNFFEGTILLPCLGAALLIISRGAGVKWLSSKFMVLVGGLSFSLYLWHWPILAFIRYVTQDYKLNAWWSCIFFALALFASLASMKLIEKPGRQLKISRKFLDAKWLLKGGVLMAPFLASTYVNANLFKAPVVQVTRYADDANICHGKIVGDCLRGDLSVPPAALVLGDSHAAQLNIFFDAFGVAENQSFKVITASSCVPFVKFDVVRLPEWARGACDQQIEFIQKLEPSFKLIILAAMWSYQMESADFISAFDGFLKETAEKGQHVIVLGRYLY